MGVGGQCCRINHEGGGLQGGLWKGVYIAWEYTAGRVHGYMRGVQWIIGGVGAAMLRQVGGCRWTTVTLISCYKYPFMIRAQGPIK